MQENQLDFVENEKELKENESISSHCHVECTTDQYSCRLRCNEWNGDAEIGDKYDNIAALTFSPLPEFANNYIFMHTSWKKEYATLF